MHLNTDLNRSIYAGCLIDDDKSMEAHNGTGLGLIDITADLS